MLFCENGTTWTDVWEDHGISRCFYQSTTSVALFVFISVCGLVQCAVYSRYAILVDPRRVLTRWGYILQVLFTVALMLEAMAHLMLYDTYFDHKSLMGYQILETCALTGACLVSIWLLAIERRSMLPSIPTRPLSHGLNGVAIGAVNGALGPVGVDMAALRRAMVTEGVDPRVALGVDLGAEGVDLKKFPKKGQGVVLLLFYALFFIRESVAFVSWNNPTWWWGLHNKQDEVELGLFILRYAAVVCLLVLGFIGPSVQRSAYSTLSQDEEAREATNRQESTWKNVFVKLRMMLPYVWPKGSCALQLSVVICLILLGVGRVVNVFVPIYSKEIVNSLTYGKTDSEKKDLHFRWDYILIFCGLTFLKGGGTGTTGLLNNLRSLLWIKVQQYTTRSVQIQLFSHLHGLSLRWHLGRKTGEVLRVIDRGTNSINNLLSYLLFQIAPTIIDIVIAIVYFVTVFDYIFGVIVFISMACYLAATFIVTEWRTKFRRQMNQRDNEANARAVDSLLNFETVKYYEASDWERERYRDSILQYQRAEWNSTASLNLLNGVQNTVNTIGLASGSLLCGWAVVHSVNGLTLTVGDYVLFGTYLAQLYVPLNWLGTYYRMIQQAFIDMENMFELLGVEEEVKDKPGAPDIDLRGAGIQFKDVSFHYEPSKQILKNINFTVKPGQTLALVGHTGCGKSTIIRLLFRFYNIQSGCIKIDGQDINSVTQKSLRKCIGVVPQDTVLFNSDIRYNIRYGRVNATDAEVEDAAKAAEIHDRILTFPKKYDAVVGERGLKLSGGEKQRVAIARTLLKAPAIVLLDEATSALDTRTERQIQSSLSQVCENRTTIIVAHRLSTIIHAHQIIVLNEGQIQECGTHQELLNQGGHYADMWQQQLVQQETPDTEAVVPPKEKTAQEICGSTGCKHSCC